MDNIQDKRATLVVARRYHRTDSACLTFCRKYRRIASYSSTIHVVVLLLSVRYRPSFMVELQTKGAFYGQSSFFAQKSQSISPVAHHPLYRSALAAFLQFHAAGVIWHPVLLLVSTVMGHHYRHYYGGRLLRGSLIYFQLF